MFRDETLAARSIRRLIRPPPRLFATCRSLRRSCGPPLARELGVPRATSQEEDAGFLRDLKLGTRLWFVILNIKPSEKNYKALSETSTL